MGRQEAGQGDTYEEATPTRQSPLLYTHLILPFYSSEKKGLPPHFRAAVQRDSTALFPKTIEASKAEIQLEQGAVWGLS